MKKVLLPFGKSTLLIVFRRDSDTIKISTEELKLIESLWYKLLPIYEQLCLEELASTDTELNTLLAVNKLHKNEPM